MRPMRPMNVNDGDAGPFRLGMARFVRVTGDAVRQNEPA